MQRLLRASELSTITGVPTSTLFHLAQDDRIPHVRIGRAVRFPEDDIAAWLQANTHGKPVEPPEPERRKTVAY